MEYKLSHRVLKSLSRGKLFRHPIHVMLVHFPSALIPTSFLFDILAWTKQNDSYAIVAFYTLVAGILTGFLAGIFGAMDYARLPPVHMAWKKASRHGFLNVLWLTILVVLCCMKLQKLPVITVSSIFEICVLGFCVLGLIYSNYLGGELVFRHKLGTYENN